MYFLYSVILAAGFALLLPRFLFDAARHGKYAAGFWERAGRLREPDSRGRPVVWLHCVSVGETQAARPLVRALLERYPAHALVVSTTTLTGQRVAREVFADTAAAVFYFPFDWALTVRRALRAINPSLVLVMETEIWPRFLRECRRRGTPVALVNGRLSETSFRRYKLVRPFIRRALGDLALAVMQTDEDAARACALGLAPERVRVAGNVKFDADAATDATGITDELRARFRFDDGRALVVAASTHAPEERVLLAAFQTLRAADEGRRARLLVAPRHPERFEEVAGLVAGSGLAWSRRSSEPDPATDERADVILLDSIGELRGVYPFADLVFVGGSVAPTGGHNVLEPAAHARCVVTGAHTFNFKTIVRDFLKRGALVQLPALPERETTAALAQVLRDLLGDEARRRLVGERARAALEENRGATARTVEMLSALFAATPGERRLPPAVAARARADV
ncbi:MAG TPA: 3-deoxy-D-manno-octulosonic acid transferase [Pyrinomonadaceae bacterium]|nr:3-deoxy-D-manno-octulosonic acid transferase [Pyrinomonadaceae bacterium]